MENRLRTFGTTSGAGADLFNLLKMPIPTDKSLAQVPEQWRHFTEYEFGSIYQLFREPHRLASQRRIEQPNKSTSVEDIVAFTQLYTPEWVVDFLLDCALPNDKCADARVIDPSCGAGHFLLKAFDRISAARSPRESMKEAALSALKQVSGCDIDELGLFVCSLALYVNALKLLCIDELPPLNLALVLDCEETPLGSLNRNSNSDVLNRRYDAVVGNPPYLGRKLLNRALKEKLKLAYPNAYQDLCAAFIARGIELLKPDGRLAYITQSSFLYLPTYGPLRKHLIDEHHIHTVVETGPHVFPLQTGEKVSSILLVLQRGKATSRAESRFLDLTNVTDKENAVTNSEFVIRDQIGFHSFRKSAWNYKCPDVFLAIDQNAFRLAEHADIRQGLATTDNARFVRWWWQVPQNELGTRWFPYAKGSGGERWYAPLQSVVDWADAGSEIKKTVADSYPYLKGKTEWVVKNEQFYFKEGLTFSFVNTGNLAVRWLPPGSIFDVGGSALFTDDEETSLCLLAYLNSSFTATFAQLLNPTINIQVGDLKQLPFFDFSKKTKERLAAIAGDCIELKKQLWSFREVSWIDGPPKVLLEADPKRLLSNIESIVKTLETKEAEIDAIVLAEVTTIAGLRNDDKLQLQRSCNNSRSAAWERRHVAGTCSGSVFCDEEQLAAALVFASILTRSPLADAQRIWIESVVRKPFAEYLDKVFLMQHTKAHHNASRLRKRNSLDRGTDRGNLGLNQLFELVLP